RRQREPRRWIVSGIVLQGFAVSGARIAFAVALVWLTIEAFRVRLGGTRSRTGVFAAVLGVLSFGAGWVTAPGDFGRWGLSNLAGDRFAIWRTAAEAIAARPIVGWGADGFAVAGPKMATEELVQGGFAPVFGELTTSPHNVFLAIGVAGGVVAILLALWFTVEIIRALLLSRKADDSNTEVRNATWSLMLYFALVLTAPAVPQVLPVFGVVLGLLLGILPATKRLSLGSASVWRRGMAITAALASLMLIVSSSGRAAVDSVGPDNAIDRAVAIQRVADTVHIDPHLHYQAALQWGYASGVDTSSASMERDIEAIDRATELDPGFYLYELERARALSFYGASDDVLVGALERVLEDYPASPEANARIGVLKVLRGSISDARVHLDLAVRQSPLDLATLSSIAQGYGLLGETALQEEYAARARDLSDAVR
ncbi:MAG: O-antigen ligase family protein, partial [Actinomycetota bacterium]|nr:O-antigen ligase family protein [Actinomycetota bacterium]